MNNQFDMVEIRDFTLPDDAKCLCSHSHAEHSIRPTPTAIGKCSACDCLTFMLDDQIIDDKVAAETARCNLVINDLKSVIKELVDVMEMQEGRENETLHIPQETALYIWRNALCLGRTALAREPVQLQPAQESAAGGGDL